LKQRIENIFQLKYFQYLVLIVVIYFVAFFKLGNFPFRLWDESMFAVNAYEMAENGNYMVPYFDGQVDWRNSKPLLLTWIQVGLIKTVGFSELTMRLPSALAVTGSILLLFTFLKRQINNLFAWIASLILLTSQGYITYHTGRTADADALMSFFVLATVIFWAKWMLEFKAKHIFFSLLFFSLAIVTKSFAALIFALPILMFTVLQLKGDVAKYLFKSKGFYAGIMLVLVTFFVIFFLREMYQPGYLDYTFSNDAGRLGKVIETHAHGWDFYLEHIFYDRFVFWTIPFLLAIPIWFNMEKTTVKTLLSFAFILIASYLLVITFSVTKLLWYDMPIYPFMACAAAVPVYFFLQNTSAGKSIFYSLAIIGLLFFIPYRKMFFASQGNTFSSGDRKEELAGIFLRDQLRNKQACDMTVYHHGYKGAVLCYQYRYADLGKKLEIKYTADFLPGEKVFVSHDSLKQVLIANYVVDTLEVYETGIFVRIR